MTYTSSHEADPIRGALFQAWLFAAPDDSLAVGVEASGTIVAATEPPAVAALSAASVTIR